MKEAGRTLPLVIEKMGDQKEKYRQLAAQCLTTFWRATPMDVERVVKNIGLVGKSARMKEASLAWVGQVSFADCGEVDMFANICGRCTKNMVCHLRALFQP